MAKAKNAEISACASLDAVLNKMCREIDETARRQKDAVKYVAGLISQDIKTFIQVYGNYFGYDYERDCEALLAHTLNELKCLDNGVERDWYGCWKYSKNRPNPPVAPSTVMSWAVVVPANQREFEEALLHEEVPHTLKLTPKGVEILNNYRNALGKPAIKIPSDD